MDIGIVAFTSKGHDLSQKIMANDRTSTFYPYNKDLSNLKAFIADKFFSCNAIIFIGAIGIAVRMIAEHIRSKDTDPAVVVIDENGEYVIPILSGHIGGANRLAISIANKIGATPVITTATDVNKLFSVDDWSTVNGCIIDDITKIKAISSAVLKGQDVGFFSDFEFNGNLPKELNVEGLSQLGIAVSLNANAKPFATTLNIIPRIITIGIGCRKNISTENLESFIIETLENYSISLKAVKAIVSIDLKKDEECIVEFAKKYKIEFKTFSGKELMEVDGDFTASEFVRATTGADNVCERSAVLESGGRLIIKKQASCAMTLAAAMSEWRCLF